MILVSGRMMAVHYGNIGDVLWLSWGWGLFIASGIIWLLTLIPVQVKQAKMATQFAALQEVPDSYWVLSKYWTIFGALATLLPLANLYFMVFKPI